MTLRQHFREAASLYFEPLSWRPLWFLRLAALYNALHGDFERSHRQTLAWNEMVAEQRFRAARDELRARRRERRKSDYAINQYDQREKRARFAMTLRRSV